MLSLSLGPKEKAVLLIGALLLLRCCERLVLPQRELLAPVSATLPSPYFRNSFGQPIQRSIARTRAPTRDPVFVTSVGGHIHDSLLPIYSRSLTASEAHELWQADVGHWLASHVPAVISTTDIPFQVRDCTRGCGVHGTCDAELGYCQCSSGWTGEACEHRQVSMPSCHMLLIERTHCTARRSRAGVALQRGRWPLSVDSVRR